MYVIYLEYLINNEDGFLLKTITVKDGIILKIVCYLIKEKPRVEPFAHINKKGKSSRPIKIKQF